MSDISKPSVSIDSLAQLYAVLFEAAELEHGIMCCYLYAVSGLRTEPSDGLPPDQLAAVRRWRGVIMSIAIEEMSHLALVSNLIVAVGARPHFGRQDFPVPPGYHPADVRVALAPFDRDTLDHFIFLERPLTSDIPDSPAFVTGPAYQRGTASGRFFQAGQDYSSIGALYLEIAAAIARLSKRYSAAVLFSGSREAQVGPDTVSLPGLLTIGNVADATRAMTNIVEQGEGASEHDEHSHFARLVAIRQEYDAILAVDPAFTPSRPIARNPVMRRPADPAGKVYVDAPDACSILDAGNAAYALMLICLVQAYARPAGHDPSEKQDLVDAAIDLMTGASRLGAALSRFPASPALPGVHAGLNFNAPRAVPTLLPGRSEWLILSGGVARLAEGVAQLRHVPEAQSIASGLAAVATKLSGHSGDSPGRDLPIENSSVWFDAAPDERRFAALKGDVEADVVVIGGGIAGMTAAWHLSQRGKKVVVLEKNHIATGDTGYTTGFMTKVPDASMKALVDGYGVDFVRRLLDAATEAQQQLFALIEGRGGQAIDCSFSRCSSLWGSYQEHDPVLAAEFAALKSVVPAVEMVMKPHGSVFAEAMRIPDEGKYNARQFLLALPGKAKGAIRVFEESEALDVAFTRDPVEVKTEGGTVKAGKVILATGRPLPAFKELLPLIDPKLTYVISAKYSGALPLGNDVQWDTLDPYFYYRTVSERELIVGGCDVPANEGGKHEPFTRLAEFVNERLPGAHAVRNEWSGSIFHTEDGLPYVFEHPHVKDRAFAVVGFGGNGMVFGFMAGRVLAALASADEDPAAGLFALERTGATVGPHEAKEKAGPGGFVSFCREDEFSTRALVMKPIGDQQIVVFKIAGKYYALDNACTHQGGPLCDGTLEGGVIQCPWHGAKFDVTTGDVTGPPARRNVKKYETRVMNGEVHVIAVARQ